MPSNNVLRNMFRVGTVSSVDYDTGRLRVVLEDKDNIVTDELPMLSFEYEMPAIGEKVLCLFFGNGLSKGLVLGRYFYQKDMPAESGKDIYFKHFLRDGFLRYNRANKTLTIHAENIVLDGNVSITGDVQIAGNLTANGNIHSGGNITAAGSITPNVP